MEAYGNCILAGDKKRLAEVLQNIMDNAIKYGDGDKITISFGREEGCCLIAVTNTGATLKTDEIPKIFDSFYRGSNAGRQSGSGLGLYICRQLMNNMNGDIFVKEDEHTFTATVVVRLL